MHIRIWLFQINIYFATFWSLQNEEQQNREMSAFGEHSQNFTLRINTKLAVAPKEKLMRKCGFTVPNEIKMHILHVVKDGSVWISSGFCLERKLQICCLQKLRFCMELNSSSLCVDSIPTLFVLWRQRCCEFLDWNLRHKRDPIMTLAKYIWG